MIIKDSHFTPSTGIFKPQKILQNLLAYVLIFLSIYLSS